MRMLVAFLTLLLCLPLWADSTSNVNVGVQQGADTLFIKAGGSMTIDGVNALQEKVSIADITGTNSSHVAVPHDASISSVVCVNDGAPNDAATLTVLINGTLVITDASVTFSSGVDAYTAVTVTPSSQNSANANDLITVTSDGGGSNGVGAHCSVFLSP